MLNNNGKTTTNITPLGIDFLFLINYQGLFNKYQGFSFKITKLLLFKGIYFEVIYSGRYAIVYHF